jgi:hypothetical protein
MATARRVGREVANMANSASRWREVATMANGASGRARGCDHGNGASRPREVANIADAATCDADCGIRTSCDTEFRTRGWRALTTAGFGVPFALNAARALATCNDCGLGNDFDHGIARRRTDGGARRAPHGVVTRAQLIARGVPPAAGAARVRAGRLCVVIAVCTWSGAGPYATGEADGGGAACGQGAALSHVSAAVLWRPPG